MAKTKSGKDLWKSTTVGDTATAICTLLKEVVFEKDKQNIQVRKNRFLKILYKIACNMKTNKNVQAQFAYIFLYPLKNHYSAQCENWYE